MSFAIKRFVAGLAIILGATAMAAPAWAEDATGPGANAVVAKRNQIANTAIGRDYFQTAHHKPQWTPDGGVFQYYSGNRGDGAIYWSAKTGAHYIYGAFLDFFSDNGHEAVLGYPLNDPQTGPGEGCPMPDVTKRQAFSQVGSSSRSGGKISTTTTNLCWGANGVIRGVVFQS